MTTVLESSGLSERKVEIINHVLEVSAPELIKMVEDSKKTLDELFAIIVSYGHQVTCLVAEMSRRNEFVEALPDDRVLREHIALIDSEPAAGLLRVIVIFAVDDVIGSARMRIQLLHSEGGAA